MQGDTASGWDEIDALAALVVETGRRVGLPSVAAQSDLGDARPMADRDGRAYAERLPWVSSGPRYLQDRSLALRSSFLHAARIFAEPFWYQDGRLGSWRTTRLLDAIDCSSVTQTFGFAGSLIAPVHLPGGQVGAVVWVATEKVEMVPLFEAHGSEMWTLAHRFLAAHSEQVGRGVRPPPVPLSAREAQCVRWAAAGKTNAEIAAILSLSFSTVRFHLRNAGTKLGAATRARLIQLATGLGFLGRNV